ncbi:class I SAM-dependent DNA methyltransferase [Spirosoma endophyticum]|uniref:site-specific DNA-methyltransferase (adenine-specific) n=1 Tax=Spirosoma endophyticum TaxID=662367 RepID=A0A1I2HR71_9BACT|nr:DNA methyltransferase [Spirosoma endophyticum]SFF32162.1 Type II restriction/modification system, DNA methylase subunit YeeA [Spirosoma endophyticum]
MTYPDFEARWKQSGGAERANYSMFIDDLCDLIGVSRPDPTTDNPTQDAYVLERAVTFQDGLKTSVGRIDLYKRGCFVLETKQGTDTPDQQRKAERAELGLPPEKRRLGHAVRGTAKWGQMMQAARQQALNYVRALPTEEPRPLFVLVADVGYCIDVYSNFAGVGDSFVPFPDQTHYRVPLSRLDDEETRNRLRLIFTEPRELDPSRRAAQVTRKLAGYLAGVSSQLERAGHAPDLVAQFLMRCLFTMFSEDVGLIPKESFTGMLRQYALPDLLQYLPDALQNLWHTMDAGGFSSDLKARLRQFNGKLFHDARALPLTAEQMQLLLKAAVADWTAVEPAIFGTLLERALDPRERHSLGAHYTPRRYVERLVLPTVIEPLRREWTTAQAAAARQLEEDKPKEARAELMRFLNRLTSLRILDPACGSGNFLYVTLEHLKRLEGEVLAAINSYGQTGLLYLSGGTTVSPRQLLGLELNPRAAAIADVVLKIGYLQWHLRTQGESELREPLLDEYENIHQQDAVLQHDPPIIRLDVNGQPVTRWDGITTKTHPVTGQQIPDETARTTVFDYPNPKPAKWPEADFIVGNPPYVGNKRMRELLGDGYADALRKAYINRVQDSADLVMYWWDKAAEALRYGRTERFGFITTSSVTQVFNRRVLQRHMEAEEKPISLSFAIPKHPWVDASDGAALDVAMMVAQRGSQPGIHANVVLEKSIEGEEAIDVDLVETISIINSDLSIGADLTSTVPLKSNLKLSSRGVIPVGQGFVIDKQLAEKLGLGSLPNLGNYIKPFLNGKDITSISRNFLIIDFFGLTEQQVINQFPAVYQHIYNTVKPQRDEVRREATKNRWWVFAEPRSTFRPAIRDLTRYIATVYVAKHRVFIFLESSVLPDDAIIGIGLDDAYHLGVLSSRIHVIWAIAAGSDLGGNTPRYNNSRCFDPFPFPDASPAQQSRIRELAEQLDAHRKRQQAQHTTLTLTDLYNVVEKIRIGEPLTAKDQLINQQGLASVVLSLHQQIDTAVVEAYGWQSSSGTADLPKNEILTRLVRLNQERAAEEQAGHIRYLRPTYQAPGQQQQLGIDLGVITASEINTVAETGPQEWPKELVQQMQAVRTLVQQADQPLSVIQVARQFKRVKVEKVQPLLDTLAALSLLRLTSEGTYA